jgi:hypothetical protein
MGMGGRLYKMLLPEKPYPFSIRWTDNTGSHYDQWDLRQLGRFAYDPRLHMALNCGSHSCPGGVPVFSSEPERLEEQLQKVSDLFFDQFMKVDRSVGVIKLPKVHGTGFLR